MIKDKLLLLYKGDSMSGSLYLFIGIAASMVGWYLYKQVFSLGLYYLSIGFLIFALYMVGKGSVMLYMYYTRYLYYRRLDQLSMAQLQEEWDYVEYRKQKKNRNRRWYLYVLVIAVCTSIYALFHIERGLILSICIPIAMMTIVELFIGVMTQFRLHEMTQLLYKKLHDTEV